MSQAAQTFYGGPIFDGRRLRDGAFVTVENGRVTAVGATTDWTRSAEDVDLRGDILSLGYVDLQVNGGGGIMLNTDPSVETIATIARAHRALGVTQLLPTLITDSHDTTRRAIAAAIAATKAGVPGVVGLHLEGPHLSVARKGAHDASLIRPMDRGDLDELLDAARQLPCLKVTVAPESVSTDQVAELVRGGVLVSLGHSDADFDTCQRYFAAGARCATHLFNAMSQIGNRAPGLAGATLATQGVSAGIIADGVHVHPEVMKIAWKAKTGPGELFLVSDAMAVAGTDIEEFELGRRKIHRRNGELRLTDGTLAGADLAISTAVSVLANEVGVPLEDALGAATRAPAELCGLPSPLLEAGTTPSNTLIRIKPDLSAASPLVPWGALSEPVAR
ncbi:MAG: N-acetylglucosamine-6-phosphate deacetylase [Pseudomonadota bacterium]